MSPSAGAWPPCDVLLIEGAVRRAESLTSAELRVHVGRTVAGNPLDRAAQIFAALGMHKTAARNGVLIYVALDSRKGAILGDQAVRAAVDPHFFEEVFELGKQVYATSGWTEAITALVEACGKELALHFPRSHGDINELPDHVSVE